MFAGMGNKRRQVARAPIPQRREMRAERFQRREVEILLEAEQERLRELRCVLQMLSWGTSGSPQNTCGVLGLVRMDQSSL